MVLDSAPALDTKHIRMSISESPESTLTPDRDPGDTHEILCWWLCPGARPALAGPQASLHRLCPWNRDGAEAAYETGSWDTHLCLKIRLRVTVFCRALSETMYKTLTPLCRVRRRASLPRIPNYKLILKRI